jgi:hypothetical protein
MEILPIIIAFIVGFAVGEGYVLFKLRHTIRRIAGNHGIDIDNELEKLEEQQTITIQIHRLEIEQHDDVLYLYDRTNENFVCQAKSIDELAKLSKSYKNIKVATVVHQDKVFVFNDGIAEEYTK